MTRGQLKIAMVWSLLFAHVAMADVQVPPTNPPPEVKSTLVAVPKSQETDKAGPAAIGPKVTPIATTSTAPTVTERKPIAIAAPAIRDSDSDAARGFWWFADKYNGAINAFATVLLTVVTAGLVVMAWRQFVTARAQLRAYVSIESTSIGFISNGALQARIVFKNFGQTPAYKLRIVGLIGVAASFESLPTPQGGPHVIHGVLSPTAAFNWFVHAPQLFNDETKAALAGGSLTLFVHGQALYEDAFGTPRTLKFRTMWGGPVGIHDKNLASCSEGNDAT